jgi:hypothetical protein
MRFLVGQVRAHCGTSKNQGDTGIWPGDFAQDGNPVTRFRAAWRTPLGFSLVAEPALHVVFHASMCPQQ